MGLAVRGSDAIRRCFFAEVCPRLTDHYTDAEAFFEFFSRFWWKLHAAIDPIERLCPLEMSNDLVEPGNILGLFSKKFKTKCLLSAAKMPGIISANFGDVFSSTNCTFLSGAPLLTLQHLISRPFASHPERRLACFAGVLLIVCLLRDSSSSRSPPWTSHSHY